MSKYRVIEKRNRFYPQYYTPERESVFLFFFVIRKEEGWHYFIDEYGDELMEKSFSTKEQAILWIKTGSPYHPDKTVWEE